MRSAPRATQHRPVAAASRSPVSAHCPGDTTTKGVPFSQAAVTRDTKEKQGGHSRQASSPRPLPALPHPCGSSLLLSLLHLPNFQLSTLVFFLPNTQPTSRSASLLILPLFPPKYPHHTNNTMARARVDDGSPSSSDDESDVIPVGWDSQAANFGHVCQLNRNLSRGARYFVSKDPKSALIFSFQPSNVSSTNFQIISWHSPPE